MAQEKVIPPNASVGEKLLGWVDARFPLMELWEGHMAKYYAPKNFNFWYFFGSLALLVLVIQIVTGIFLVMNYKPDSHLAFYSVENIMRDVPAGWLIRTIHSTGASAFFIVVYMHMFRGLMYGSYRKPRELIWVFGVLIFLCLMAEAFFGYLLPWGQMSFWGAKVITSLFDAIPYIGGDLSTWIRGDYNVGDATLNRFFSFHVIAVPLVLIGLVAAHIMALHEVGSNNPDGVEIKAKKDANGVPLDGIPFHPYYTVHDLMGVAVFLFLFATVVFYAPSMGGYFLEANNFLPADALKTPQHIAPVWYFTPYYSMLRATTDDFKIWLDIADVLVFFVWLLRTRPRMVFAVVGFVIAAVVLAALQIYDAKFFGVVIMGGAVLILFFLPWLDNSPVKSLRYRPTWHWALYLVFVVVFLVLGYLGTQEPNPVSKTIAQVGTLYYFAFFVGMPIWSRWGTFKPVPDRVVFHAH